MDNRGRSAAPIGILCALPEEMRLFRGAVEDARTDTRGGTEVVTGLLDGAAVALADAGIGKVNAAVTAALLCDRYGCNRLVLSGVGGALDPAVAIGDVVVGTRLIQHDYGRSTDAGFTPYRPGVWPFPGTTRGLGWDMSADMEARLRAAVGTEPLPGVRVRGGDVGRAPLVHFGTILTGDAFIAGDGVRQGLVDRFGGLLVEMEGAAVAQVAERFGARWLVIRAASDLAGHDSGIDFRVFLDDAAHTAATLLRRLLPAL